MLSPGYILWLSYSIHFSILAYIPAVFYQQDGIWLQLYLRNRIAMNDYKYLITFWHG